MSLALRLNHEWQILSARPVGAWADACPPLAAATTLDDVAAAARHSPDTVLAFLVGRAQSGDEVAARTVVQLMLGKMVLLAGRGCPLDDLVAHLAIRIATYPLERRPTSVAANLALDTLKATLQDRRRNLLEVPTPDFSLHGLLERRPGPATQVDAPVRLLDLALRVGLITPTTHDVLRAVYVDQIPGAAAAERWNCSEAAIRSRCRYGLRAIRPHIEDLVAA